MVGEHTNVISKYHLTIVLSFLFIIMLGIAYVSGGEVAERYGQQMIYAGHEIYVANPTTASIDNNPAEVVNIGDVNVNSFNVYSVDTSQNIVVLDHSIKGIAGSTEMVGYLSNEQMFMAGQDINYMGVHLSYKGKVNNIFVYSVNGMNVGVVQGEKTIITIGQNEYVLMEKIDSTGTPYISVFTNLIKNITLNSILLMMVLCIAIYFIGEFAIWGEFKWK